MTRLYCTIVLALVSALLASCLNPQGAATDGKSGGREDPDKDGQPVRVSEPVLDPPPDSYETDTLVTMSVADPSHGIYFTTDGSAPDRHASQYSEPVSISGDGTAMELRAVAIDAEGRSSSIAGGTYSVRYRYGISASAGLGGTVTVDPPVESVLSGELAEFAAQPKPGYTFAGWEPNELGTENPLLLEITGDVSVHGLFSALQTENVLRGGITVHELLADPTGSPGFDTDGNGTAETTDEFVELLNIAAAPVSLAGLELWDPGAGLWFSFPTDSILAAGAAAVVVVRIGDGGALPSGTAFEAGRRSVLNNSGDVLVLYDPAADEYIQLGYAGAAPLDPASAWSEFSGTATQVGSFGTWPGTPDGESLTKPSAGAVAETVRAHGELFGSAASPGWLPER